MENLLEMLLHDARNQLEDAPVIAMGLLYPGSRIATTMIAIADSKQIGCEETDIDSNISS